MSERPPAPGPVGSPPRPAPTPGPSAALPWERFFPALPPDVQQSLLRRAAEQGGLSARDLPAPPAAPPANPIARVLAADPDALPPFTPAEPADLERHPAEAHALSAALGCPDVFLVDCDPGPDRTAFAAELAAEAARAGERVLVLTGVPAEADAVLGRLSDRPDLLSGRALAYGEHAERLPVAVADRTARAHGEDLLARARVKAAEAARDAARTAANLRTAAGVLETLRPVAARLGRHRADEAALPDRIAAETDTPFAASLREADDAHAAVLARIDAEAQKAAAELATRRAELDALKHPPKKGGIAGLLKGLFGGSVPPEQAAKGPALEESVRQLEAAAARLAEDRATADTAHRTRRGGLVRGEIERRRVEMAPQREAAEAEFRRGCEPLAAVGFTPPEAPTADGLDRTAAALADAVNAAGAEAGFARGWADEIAARGPELVRRLLGLVRVVVGPVAAVGHDRFLADGGFDRVIATDADALGDVDSAALARLGARWVLLGDADAPAPRGPHGRRNGRPHPRPSLFRRLWGRLHRPAWVEGDGRLVAVLQPCDPVDLRGEPLADRPEIELRFGRGPGGEPVLAEVAFPPHVTPVDARGFLAGELGEVRLAPCGPARWHEAADHVTAYWPAAAGRDAGDWVELGGGVRERVTDAGRTAAVAFDKAAGWDRDRAADWLARHAATPRAAVLPRPVRVADTPAPRVLVGAVG